MDKEVHTFPKGFGLKVNIAWLEFKIAYYDVAVQHNNQIPNWYKSINSLQKGEKTNKLDNRLKGPVNPKFFHVTQSQMWEEASTHNLLILTTNIRPYDDHTFLNTIRRFCQWEGFTGISL